MTFHAEPIPREKNQPKKRKSEQSSSDPSEDELTYGIERLNLGEDENDLETESKGLLAKRREGHMAYKKDKDNRIKHDCNVLYVFIPHKTRKT